MILPSWSILGALLPLLISAQQTPHRPEFSLFNYYVLEFDPYSLALLSDAASALGVEVIEQVGQLRDHWLVRSPKHEARNADPVVLAHRSIQARATDSSYLGTRSPEALRTREIAHSIRNLLPQELRQRSKRDAFIAERAPPPIRPSTEKDKNATTSPAHLLATRLGIEDPIFPDQWHFVNEEFPQHIMNVTGVWEELGITGKGVAVAMVDDGVDYTHADLADNFVSSLYYTYVTP